MKQLLRYVVLSLFCLAGLFETNAAVVSSIAEVKSANGGDLTISTTNPVYVMYVDNGYYMLYDGTAGIFFYDDEGHLSGVKKGDLITGGTIYFGYISFIKQFNLYKNATSLNITNNGALPEPVSLPSTLELYDRGTYFTAHGTISDNSGSIQFVPDEGSAYELTNFFNISGIDFSSLAGKTGTIKAVVTYSGSATKYSPIEADFFISDGGDEPATQGTFASVFGPLRGTGNVSAVSMEAPAAAQILFANPGQVFVWDGTMGVGLYSDYGSSYVISGFDYASMKDGFGYSFSGTMSGWYDDSDNTFTPDAGLVLGAKTSVTPIVATGAEVGAADRSMLYTYVQMKGTYTASTRVFVADDGTEFAVYGSSPRGIPTADGHGTIKAFMYGGAGNGKLVSGNSKMQLVTLEDNAFTYDEDSGAGTDPEPETKTFAQIIAESTIGQEVEIEMPANAQMLYEFVNSNGYADFECILWDGTAGLRLYVSGGLSSIIPDRTNGSRNFGKTISGTLKGALENDANFYDYYVSSSANLQLGSVSEVKPKIVAGKDCLKADKSNLNAYVQMTGIFNYMAQTFTADDGQVFNVNTNYSTVSLPYQDGQCTIKALFAGGISGSLTPSSGNPHLFLLEDGAITFGGDTPTEVRTLSLADLKKEPTGLINFKLEESKVQAVAVAKAATAYEDDKVYFWDGTDGLMVYGDFTGNDILNALKGQVANGEIFGTYYPNYGGMIKYDKEDSSNKVAMTLGTTKTVNPLLVTLADVLGKSDNTYSYAYIKAHGKISDGKFVDGTKELDIATTAYSADLSVNNGKAGYIYGIYDPNGYIVITDTSYFEADDVVENKYNSFKEIITTAEDQEPIAMTLPAGTQVLDNEGKHLWLWDGTTGLYIYSENGYDTTISGLTDHANGNLLTGKFEGTFDESFFDIELSNGEMQLGTKQELTAKPVRGNEAIREDRANLYAYVEMQGTYDVETNIFTSDDEVPFTLKVSETSGISLPTQSGHGTLTAMVYGNGTGELFDGPNGALRLIEPNAFVIDNDAPGSVSIADFMNTVENGKDCFFRMPSNAVILLAGLYNLYVWDGTAGMLIYSDNQTGSFLRNWNLNEGNYTGYKILGEFNAKFNNPAYSFDNPTSSSLTIGEMVGVMPKQVTGAEACNEDRSNLYAYIEMTGTYDTATKVFVADDGTEFAIYGSSTIGIPYDDGHGTIKAMMFGNRGLGKIRQDENSMPYLLTLESDAFALDAVSINDVETAEVDNVRVYGIDGQYYGNDIKSLKKGVYVVNGKKIVLK